MCSFVAANLNQSILVSFHSFFLHVFFVILIGCMCACVNWNWRNSYIMDENNGLNLTELHLNPKTKVQYKIDSNNCVLCIFDSGTRKWFFLIFINLFLFFSGHFMCIRVQSKKVCRMSGVSMKCRCMVSACIIYIDWKKMNDVFEMGMEVWLALI